MHIRKQILRPEHRIRFMQYLSKMHARKNSAYDITTNVPMRLQACRQVNTYHFCYAKNDSSCQLLCSILSLCQLQGHCNITHKHLCSVLCEYNDRDTVRRFVHVNSNTHRICWPCRYWWVLHCCWYAIVVWENITSQNYSTLQGAVFTSRKYWYPISGSTYPSDLNQVPHSHAIRCRSISPHKEPQAFLHIEWK